MVGKTLYFETLPALQALQIFDLTFPKLLSLSERYTQVNRPAFYTTDRLIHLWHIEGRME